MYAKYFVLFTILFTGWFLKRIKFIDDKMNKSINKLIVYFAYPCLIVHNIGTIEMTSAIIADFFTTVVVCLVAFYVYGAVSYFYAKARHLPQSISNTAEMSMILPNDGFMGFPMALLFFGEKGMLLMLAHNAAMNFFTFTYGMAAFRRNKERAPGEKRFSFRSITRALLKLLVNPNILALFIGFAISIPHLTLPGPVDEYLLYIGNISTPMAMIYIGSTLANYKFTDIIRNTLAIEASIMKLIWIPLITIALVYFLPVSGLIKSIAVLGGAFPTAATASMLAEQEDQAPGTASQILFLSTVASIASIPLMVNVLEALF